MNNKEKFFEEVEEIINSGVYGFSSSAIEGYEELKNKNTQNKELITENGKAILTFMQDNVNEYDNKFKAKIIGEGLFTSGRAISGSMRKLITDGFVFKNSGNPVTYSLTDMGKSYQFDK